MSQWKCYFVLLTCSQVNEVKVQLLLQCFRIKARAQETGAKDKSKQTADHAVHFSPATYNLMSDTDTTFPLSGISLSLSFFLASHYVLCLTTTGAHLIPKLR